jgi:hypothetical protein
VSILILGWPHVRDCASLLRERRLWIPRHLRPRSAAVPVWLAHTGGAACLAWLGSAALVAYSNGLIIPGALPMNVALSLLAYLCLALAVPKVLAAGLGLRFLNSLLAHVLGFFVSAIGELVRMGSTRGASLGTRAPSACLVLVYYTSLAGMLWPRAGRRLRLVAGVVFAGSLALLVAGVWRRESAGSLEVWYGGEAGEPVVLVHPGGGLDPLLLNSGGSDMSREVEAMLRTQGFHDLELYVASSRRWASLSGAARLLRCMPAACVGMPAGPTDRSELSAPEELQLTRGGRVRTAVPPVPRFPGGTRVCSGAVSIWFRDGCGDTVMYTASAGRFLWVTVRREAGGRVFVHWRERDGRGGACALYPCWRRSLTIVCAPPG